MALTFDSVAHTYDQGRPHARRALSAVDLTVEPGELVVVAGVSGSGKSTLLRLAAGVLTPTAGRVLVDGRRHGAEVPAGSVGLVFQDPETQLFGETVIEDVAFGPRNLGASRAEARRIAAVALDRVGLDDERFAEASPHTLSGGEARRAAIAGVLALEPAYLAMDEPTAGLDSAGRRSVKRVVGEARSRMGVLLASHDLDEWIGLADRVVLLADGVSEQAPEDPASPAASEVYARAGLPLPALVRVAMAARERGAPGLRPSPDVEVFARDLLDAAGWSR